MLVSIICSLLNTIISQGWHCKVFDRWCHRQCATMIKMGRNPNDIEMLHSKAHPERSPHDHAPAFCHSLSINFLIFRACRGCKKERIETLTMPSKKTHITDTANGNHTVTNSWKGLSLPLLIAPQLASCFSSQNGVHYNLVLYVHYLLHYLSSLRTVLLAFGQRMNSIEHWSEALVRMSA